ncbi:MAG TPA: HEAT repeat domain-containing protein [Candidatus Rifleibacterium sp.]|nr:HEAT repeat domain-containing protein [Candidatus Rifleibacterium sp.]HPT47137.1 HEAT repeat domain-containing protein [Candidatus Rifleibacterium sp.]
MMHIEIKILALTLVYFVGWFMFEKIFSGLWRRWRGEEETAHTGRPRARVVPLASVTPVDQTWRYIKGLKSPDWRIRRISCLQLGDRRGTAVVEALIGALDDPREEVSMAAGEALARIGDPAAIEAMAGHCRNLETSSGRSYENYRAA